MNKNTLRYAVTQKLYTFVQGRTGSTRYCTLQPIRAASFTFSGQSRVWCTVVAICPSIDTYLAGSQQCISSLSGISGTKLTQSPSIALPRWIQVAFIRLCPICYQQKIPTAAVKLEFASVVAYISGFYSRRVEREICCLA